MVDIKELSAVSYQPSVFFKKLTLLPQETLSFWLLLKADG
jgi:hypothetical protein